MEGPILALWWIPAGTIPTVLEAMAKLQLLKECGPSPDSFTFRTPFPAPADEVRILPTAERYVEGFARVLDFVARERKYIGFIEGPPVDGTRQWIKSLEAGAGVQMLVLDGEEVVGWCDITPNPIEGFRHVGRLGMGLMPDFRGRGLGRRVAEETIRAARAAGMERIELEVFASNARAIRLYQSMGFVVEGVKKQARKLDGEYDDNVCMALLLEFQSG
jgi:RimJ/RimL family protein N-acetyltransferase